MGRLRQSKVAEIKALWEQNYTIAEISEKTHVSRGTVSKYTKEWEKEKGTPPGGTASPVLEVVTQAFFNLLLGLSVLRYLDQDALSEIADQEALKLLRRLSKTDREFARHIIKNTDYLTYLKEGDILNFKIPDTDLDEEGIRQRRAWVQLLKEFFPEELAALM